ncbi:hypothetical protein DZA01_25090 [Pseudomonas aeruginosa]|nr:hypothetical protein DZA01_25090 [Pseudomonas aeruginosa]
MGHRGNPFEGKVLSEYTAAMTTASLSSAVGYCSQRSNRSFPPLAVPREYPSRRGGAASHGR